MIGVARLADDRLLERQTTAVLRSSLDRLRLAVYLDDDAWTDPAALAGMVPRIDSLMRQLPELFPVSGDRFFFEFRGTSDTDIGVTGYVYDSTFSAAMEATARINQMRPRDGAFTHSAVFTNRLSFEGLTPCGDSDGRWICTHTVILLDVQMPGESGFNTFASLRENEATAEIPVVMVTGVAEKTGIKFSGKEMGEFIGKEPNGYLEKPIDPEGLKSTVASVCP